MRNKNKDETRGATTSFPKIHTPHTQFQQNVNEKPANKPISAIEFDVEKSMRISKHYNIYHLVVNSIKIMI